MRRNMRREELLARTQEAGRVAMRVGREVWLASLGTAIVVGEESRRMFERFVAEGQRLQDEQKANVTGTVGKLTGRVRTVGDQVQAGVQDAMASTLHRLGIPTHDDIQTLLSRVEQLSAKVRTLNAR